MQARARAAACGQGSSRRCGGAGAGSPAEGDFPGRAAVSASTHAGWSDDEAERLLEPALRLPSSVAAPCGGNWKAVLPLAASRRATRPAKPSRPTPAVPCKVHKSVEGPPAEGTRHVLCGHAYRAAHLLSSRPSNGVVGAHQLRQLLTQRRGRVPADISEACQKDFRAAEPLWASGAARPVHDCHFMGLDSGPTARCPASRALWTVFYRRTVCTGRRATL